MGSGRGRKNVISDTNLPRILIISECMLPWGCVVYKGVGMIFGGLPQSQLGDLDERALGKEIRGLPVWAAACLCSLLSITHFVWLCHYLIAFISCFC